MGDALGVTGLTKVYRGRGDVRAVDGVDLRVGVNEIVGLLGPNGAGKTTTLKSVCGLLVPTSGTITVAGVDVARQRPEALRRLGAVLEGNRTVYWRLTVSENLEYFAALRGLRRRDIAERAGRLIEMFDLGAKIDTPAMKLSRGMQQKLAVAAALVVDPTLLLLDEPTLGLDVETSHELRGHLKTLVREGDRGILLSSHDMAVIRDVCDRVVIINHGRVVADDSVDHLLDLFRTTAYEVNARDPLDVATLARLRALFPLVTHDPETPRSASVALRSAEELYPLVDTLRASGVIVEAMQPVEPDLEQVFLALVRKPA